MNATPPFSVPSGRIARLILAPALLIAAVLLSSGTTIHAATIGVSFSPSGFGLDLPPAMLAGVVQQDNWKNILNTTTSSTITSTTLNDNSGTPTAALTVSGTSLGLGYYNPVGFTNGGDERLMDAFLSSSGTMTLNVTSIPYASYDLIIYNLPLFTNVLYTYTVTGSDTYYGRSPVASNTSAGYVDNNGGTPFNYLEATSTDSLNPTLNSTYTRYEGLSGDLTFTITGGNGISYINGFQIVESVPEPSRAMLLLAGLLTIVGRRTRRRL